jgi:4-amino-4-deoxy-L-arabinose transferase-like glycosyltransferase
LALFFAVALTILLPRAPALDQFITPDENAWSGRSQLFLDALHSGDYAGTYQTEHPGVTTMWSGIAGRLLGPLFPVEDAANWNDKDAGIAAGRTFVALANTVALSLAFVFAWQLFGLLPALLGVLLIALDPFHLAHSRVLHLDALLSSFVLLALLAFLSYLRHRRPAALIVSGIAAGLSWLTKSPSLFLGPIIGLLALIAFGRSLHHRDGRPLTTLLWRSAWPLIIWGLVATAAFVLLWPAMWVDPLGTVARVLGPALAHAQGGHGEPLFFAGEIYPRGLIGASVWQFYPISYLWRTTPVVLLGLLAAGVAVVFRLGPLARPGVRHAALGLLLCALVYGLLMNLGAKKFDRYLLPAFAPLDLLAALGLVSVAAWIAGRMRPGLARRALVPLFLVSIVLLQAALSLPTYPYYLSYYNPLLGGGQNAHKTLMIGWGEGLDEAGRYLTSKPNAQDLQVAAWYLTCFAPYYAGNIRGIPIETDVSDAQLAELLASDYLVVYIHQWQRAMPRPLLEILAGQTPEHSVEINGVEYVRIYKGASPP